MAQSPFNIARYFIENSTPEGDFTPMKLLKLVYVAHGWYLGFNGKPLVKDSVEAWQYGPVIPSLYYGIKEFGREVIPTDKAELVGGELEVNGEADLTDFLNSVATAYRQHSGFQLSALTHAKGTPWHQVWTSPNGGHMSNAVIPATLIEEHYREKIERQRQAKNAGAADGA